MSKNPVIMLQMVVTMLPEQEIVDKAIKELIAYKESGYSEEHQPVTAVMMVLLKIEQGNKPMEEVMRMAFKHNEIVTKVDEAYEKEKAMSSNKQEDNVDKTSVIPMGKHGDA